MIASPRSVAGDAVLHGEGEAIIQKKIPGKEIGDLYDIYGNINVLHTLKFNSDALCCRFSHDGSKIAIGLSDGNVKVCKSSTGEMIYHLAAPLPASDAERDNINLPTFAVTSLHFVPPEFSDRGEVLIVTYCGGLVKVWHVSSSSALSTIKENRQTLASEISQNYNHLITAGTSDELLQYDMETNKVVHKYAPRYNKDVMDGHRFRVHSVKFNPTTPTNFVSGGWDDTLQVWDTREAHSVRHFYGPHICGGDAIDIDPVYDHILTSSWRRNDVLEVWDFKSGEKIQTFKQDFHGNSMLYCGQWLGEQHLVCGGSDKNMIKITNKTTLETIGVISELGTGVYSVDFDRNNVNSNDITTLAAVSGSCLHIFNNLPQPPQP